MYEPRSKVWHKLSVSAGGHLSSFKLRNKAISMYRFFAHHARWYHWFTFPWLSVPVNVWAGIRYVVSTRKHAQGQISGHGHHSSPGTTPPEKP